MSTSRRVFVAEDDEEFRKLLVSVLVRAGFDVVEARDGVELAELLVAAAADGGVALVVTDVRMPGQSGLAVLAALREHDVDTPVILITGFGDGVTRAEAERLGATAVLDKPFGLATLRDLAVALTRAA
jgi:DNA-binding NtrC family response regulator